MKWAVIMALVIAAWTGRDLVKSNYQLVCAQLENGSDTLPNVRKCSNAQ
ncbi:MAG: hypothetical protein ACJAQU_000321 [Loktanella salsilacus]|jgi:hypothetical protein